MKDNYHAPETIRKPERCPKCSSINLQEYANPPHVGLYCNHCGQWLRWIPKRFVTTTSVLPVTKLHTKQQIELPLLQPGNAKK